VRVRALTRGQIKRWLASLLSTGLDRETVRLAYAVLHNLLNHALDDEVISANPASKLGRALRLLPAPGERAARVKAMDADQLDAFLDRMRAEGARPQDARHYPFFLLLARTGLRLGEAFALQPGDLDFTRQTVQVERAFSGGSNRPRRRGTPSAPWTSPRSSPACSASGSRPGPRGVCNAAGASPGSSCRTPARPC
jgi:integrase